MITGAPRSALHEAQRLLLEHGHWTTEGGAYLESAAITVLIDPVLHEEADAPDAAVDVVITVRPRPSRVPPGATIVLGGPAGRVLTMPLNHRGQAVFRRLPAGEWSARLDQGEPAGEVVPMRRVPRRLAVVAGSGPHQVQETYASSDGRLVETDEAHLVVKVSAADSAAPAPVAMVRIRWGLVVREAVSRVSTLVVPLASTGHDGAVAAKFDLGSVDQAEAVDIAPAEWADPSELTQELVRQAFDLPVYISARRAWEKLAAAGVCEPAVQEALLAALRG